MTQDKILTGLSEIMREFFDNDHLQISRSTTAADVEGWDSMNHINIIIAAEQMFKVRIKTAEVEGLHSVGALVDLIERKTSH